MKRILNRTILVITCFMLLQACNKDEVKPFQFAFLSAGNGQWKLAALVVTAQGQTQDIFPDIDACEKDNIIYFNDDGTFQMQTGVTKCDPAEPTILESGTWSRSTNGRNLIVELTGEEPETWVIKVLNETTLKCTTVFDIGGIKATVTSTYTKQ